MAALANTDRSNYLEDPSLYHRDYTTIKPFVTIQSPHQGWTQSDRFRSGPFARIKMLFVFLVDTGVMYTFDVELAMERYEAGMTWQTKYALPDDSCILWHPRISLSLSPGYEGMYPNTFIFLAIFDLNCNNDRYSTMCVLRYFELYCLEKYVFLLITLVHLDGLIFSTDSILFGKVQINNIPALTAWSPNLKYTWVTDNIMNTLQCIFAGKDSRWCVRGYLVPNPLLEYQPFLPLQPYKLSSKLLSLKSYCISSAPVSKPWWAQLPVLRGFLKKSKCFWYQEGRHWILPNECATIAVLER